MTEIELLRLQEDAQRWREFQKISAIRAKEVQRVRDRLCIFSVTMGTLGFVCALIAFFF